MLYAIIETGEENPIILKLPRNQFGLGLKLRLQGIMASPDELNLAEGNDTGMWLKANDELWGKFIRLCREADTLEDINDAAYRIKTAEKEIKHDLQDRIKQGKYTNLPELHEGIEFLKRCVIKFYCPLSVRFVGTDGWEEECCDSSLLYDSASTLKKAVQDASRGAARKYTRNDPVRGGKDRSGPLERDSRGRGRRFWSRILHH